MYLLALRGIKKIKRKKTRRMPPKRWVCACARSFKSRRALLQHLDDKACLDVPEPEIAPEGSSFDDGEWIPFIDGKKRLAYFECIECGNCWMSGNGFVESWQACRQCELDAFPEWRWQPCSTRRSSKPKVLAHHDSKRCQRCLAGNLCVP